MEYYDHLRTFTQKWGPPLGDPNHAQFVEELRKLIVAGQVSFRKAQKSGVFQDETGDKYLERCEKSFLSK